ncbi:MAG: hypothetical protein Tsb0014_26270 [Pleurocapsa sp.]
MKQAIFPFLQIGICTFGYFCGTSNTTLAQVIPDATVNTQVNQNGKVAEITGGETRGGNLFHSFQEFSLPTGNEAFFNNADTISNIFSRVTGGKISNIDGLIRANGNASLFLINPNGIVFGENAALNLGGSFYASTADSIIFSDDVEFSATNPKQPPLLTVNMPIGLSFGNNPGNIINRASTGDGLEVLEGNNISLIGGNVSVENGGIIFAPAGRIELGGLLKTGTVNFNNDGSLSFPDNVARGNVSLTDSSIVSVLADVGGSIGVNAANLEIASGSRFLGGIRAGKGSVDAQAGNIIIDATDSVLINGQGNSNITGILNNVNTNSLGNAGDINITTTSLTLKNKALIGLYSDGQGNAGNITINARDFVLFDNNAVITTGILSSASDNANAGDINITTGNLTLNNDANLYTLSDAVLGIGGDIVINATDSVSIIKNSGIGVSAAEGGSLTINAKNFELSSGSNIFAGIAPDIAREETQAGNIIINTSEDVLIDAASGETITTISNSNLGISNAGNVEISGRNISFINGAATTSFSNGAGNGGNITLTATENILFDGIFQKQTEDRLVYQVGGINNSLVILADNSVTNKTGIPGNVNVKAKNLTITNGAAIQSFVNGDADSGDINVDISNSINIDKSVEAITQDGTIQSSASGIQSIITRGGSGNSGDINVKTNELSITNGGNISTDNFGIGNAGDINITANSIDIDGQGVYTEFTNNNGENFKLANISSISSRILSSVDLFPDGIVAEGNGGNISLDTNSLSIANG